MARIRLMHIVQCAGGVDCYLRMLLKHMDKMQYEHILVCSEDFSCTIYEPLVEKFEQVMMVNSLSLRHDGVAIIKVRRLIKQYDPDLIYCHSSKGGGIGRLASIGLGIPVIYNPHGWSFSMRVSKLKSFLFRCIEKILAHFTHTIIAISYYEKFIALEQSICKSKKIHVIYNGIDFNAIELQSKNNSITRHSLGIPENAYIVGMSGRISDQKAPDIFVHMAERIHRVIPESYFIIVGDGNQKEEIERMIVERDLSPYFRITGWQDKPWEYMALFDQAVLLSRWEGFGLVLAEYMFLGKPIVATNINAIPELINDQENGLLIPCDDDYSAAEAVLKIYYDTDLRDKFIQNGRIRSQILFDIKRVAKSHERLFAAILSNIR